MVKVFTILSMRSRNDPANGISIRQGGYWFSRYVDKVREWHNLETTDLFEAMQRKAEILRSPALLASTDSLSAACERFLKYRFSRGEYTRATLMNARSALRCFAQHAGEGATLTTVRTVTIQRWYDEQRTKGTDSSAAQYLITVRALFRWAVETARVRTDNPAVKVQVTKAKSPARVRFVDRATRDALIKRAPNDEMKFILFCGFHAGLRLNEISEARVFWFDVEHGLMHVRRTPLPRGQEGKGNGLVKDIYGIEVMPFTPKGKKDRTIPLTESFQKFLKRLLRKRKPHEFVGQPDRFGGQALYRWNFKKVFARYMKSQGQPWVSPHILRHTMASLLVQKGVSLFKVAAWLGDTLQIAEQHYAHLAPLDADIQHLD
jgi:integrase